MKTVNKIIRIVLILVVIVLLGFGSLIIYALVTDYKPEDQELITLSEKPAILNDSLSVTLLTWNIGYAGLDRKMDFFFDGGTKVITPENQCSQNLIEIGNFLRNNDTIDFIFLQEVDKGSKRSYFINEFDTISSGLKDYYSSFGKNYDVFFVPKPVSEPMGKVLSGVATFSKYEPASSTRYSLPGDFGFPTQLFWLDRCFLVNRYKLANSKELVLINTHMEAFDEGDIRKAQMEYLKTFVLNEYNNGNYVIAGGDWNQCPPGFTPDFKVNKVNMDQMIMESDYLFPEWKWVYDSSTPSNRSVITEYDPATTTTTVIDFFLISPNIEGEFIKCIQLDFNNSDHNPVIIKARLDQN